MIIYRGPVAGGEITIFDTGYYRFEGEDARAGFSIVQIYRYSEGPERLRIFVDRVLAGRASRDVSTSLTADRAGAVDPASTTLEAPVPVVRPPLAPLSRDPSLSSTPTLAERGLVSSTGTTAPPLDELRRRLEENERQLQELRTDIARRRREERAQYAVQLAQGLIRSRTRTASFGDGFDTGGRASPWDIEQAVREGVISEDYANAIRFAVQAGVLRGQLQELILRDQREGSAPRYRVDPSASPQAYGFAGRRPPMVPTELQRAIDAGLIEEASTGSLTVAGARGLSSEWQELDQQFPGVSEIHFQTTEAVRREAMRRELRELLLTLMDLALAVAGLAVMLLRLGALAGSRLLLRMRRAGTVLRGEEAAVVTAEAAEVTEAAVAAEATEATAEGAASRGGRRLRPVRDYDVGVDRLVRRRHSIGEAIRRSPTLREYMDAIMQVLRGTSWQQIQQRARSLSAPFRGSAASRRGAINNLKGLLQEHNLTALPWFSRTRTAALMRLRRINATLAAEQRFTETVHFTSDVRVSGRELSDGIFFAPSLDGSRIIILDIIEAKSSRNWTALYTGSRAQIRRDIRRFLQEAVTIDGHVFRHSDGSLRFMSDYGQRQAWTLSVPRQIASSPSVIERLRAGAARSQVSGTMASDFTVKFGALPDAEARSLAEIILEGFSEVP